MKSLFLPESEMTARQGLIRHEPESAPRTTRDGAPPRRSAAGAGLLSQAGNRSLAALYGGADRGSPARAGQPLDGAARQEMESRFGTSFSGVRIHTGPEAEATNARLGARAFTRGQDIHFGQEGYRPTEASGRTLLAHELAHVIQQRDGHGPAGPGHEREARQAAGEVAAGRDASVTPGNAGPGIQKADASPAGTSAERDRHAPAPESEGFFSKVGHVLGSIGHGIASGASAVWGGLKWLGGQLIDKIAGIFSRVFQWVRRLPERVGRLFSGLLSGLASLHVWSLDWWKSLGQLSTWKQFLKWTGARIVEIAELLGLGEIYETLADWLKFNTTTLDDRQARIARSVFGSSINLSMVRVDTGAVIGPSWSDRAYTSFHVINNWGALDDQTLVHELTHVWQYEHAGAIYMPQAIHAQVWGGGYDYGGAAALRAAQTAGRGLLSFNREQQAQIVEDFYMLKTSGTTMMAPDATPADLPVYAHFVKQVSTLTEAQLLAP